MTQFTMSPGSLRVRQVMSSSLLLLTVVYCGGICVIWVDLLTNWSSETEINLMVKFMEVPVFVTMLKLILIDSSLVVSKVTQFFAREEITNLKFNGDSERKLASIMDLFMPYKETLSRKNTSCLWLIGQPKSGQKNSKSLLCRPAITIHI